MIYVYLINLYSNVPEDLLITIQSCTVLISLYAIILTILFSKKNKNKLN